MIYPCYSVDIRGEYDRFIVPAYPCLAYNSVYGINCSMIRLERIDRSNQIAV